MTAKRAIAHDEFARPCVRRRITAAAGLAPDAP